MSTIKCGATLTVAFTIIYGVWSENERAETNFEVKVVEIVMNTKSPVEAINKAEAIIDLFPKRLSLEFQNNLRKYSEKVYQQEGDTKL